MTIPAIVQNVQSQIYVGKLKKSYSMFQEGFKRYMGEENTTDLSLTNLYTDYTNKYSNLDKLVNKYFKVAKVCQIYASSCDLTNIKGTYLSTSGSFNEFSNSYYNFCTVDGVCFKIFLNNQIACVPYAGSISRMKSYCADIDIDINSAAPPNKMGRDFYSFYMDYSGNLFPAMGEETAKYFDGINWQGSGDYWEDNDTNCGNPINSNIDGAHGWGCAARIIEEGWRMTY